MAAGGLLSARVAGAQPCFDLGTFAGRGVGDGGPALAAVLAGPREVTTDSAGNVFVADSDNARVRRVDLASGVITTIAGTGAPGSGQDGVPAALSPLRTPSGVAVAPSGDVYIADSGDATVWKVTTDGILHRVAGSGIATGSLDGDRPGQPGNDPTDDLNDGQLAVFATLNGPVRVTLDTSGNMFISDILNNRIRRVDAATQRISTLASATEGINAPIGLAFGPSGDLFVANRGVEEIIKLSPAGTITVVAGNGVAGDPVNEVPATSTSLRGAGQIAVDASGVVFIGDTDNQVIRKVTPDGIIHAVAGVAGIADFRDGPGIFARFNHPGPSLAPGGTLVIADVDNNAVRRYDPAADRVTTVAGGPLVTGDGGPATQAILSRPTGLAVNPAGSVFITEHDSHRVRRVDPGGTISTVVNQHGLSGSARDGMPAINEELQQPTGVEVDAAGNLFIADAQDQRVILVDPNGIVHSFAGNGTAGFAGDGGLAVNAMLNTPLRVAARPDGVYIADFNNHRIRHVDTSGVISTVAGTGLPGRGGDGGPATAAQLNQPAGLTFDGAGNLFIADFSNNLVRRIDTQGTITTIAGSGTAGGLGDGGPASAAQLNGPTDVIVASDGALLVVDQLNNKVRRLGPDDSGAISGSSTITTILGDGRPAFADGPGLQASMLIPTDVAIDLAGNILVADRGNQRVRITTAATDCTNAGGGGGRGASCQVDAECNDNDACTTDRCLGGTCRHDLVLSGDCRPKCSMLPDGCIPGGGAGRVDCLAEALVEATPTIRHGVPAPVVRCHDGDSSCDFDTTPGQCTFRLAWCLNNSDPRLPCGTTGVASLVARGPAAGTLLDALVDIAPQNANRIGSSVAFPSPLDAPDTCTHLMEVAVGLRKGGTRPGKLQIKATAVGAGRPRARDVDKVRLVCLP